MKKHERIENIEECFMILLIYVMFLQSEDIGEPFCASEYINKFTDIRESCSLSARFARDTHYFNVKNLC